MSVADAIVIGLMLGTVLALAWAVGVSWLVLRQMRSSKPTSHTGPSQGQGGVFGLLGLVG